MDMTAGMIIVAMIFLWGTASARLMRADLTAPIEFVAVGALLGATGLTDGSGDAHPLGRDRPGVDPVLRRRPVPVQQLRRHQADGVSRLGSLRRHHARARRELQRHRGPGRAVQRPAILASFNAIAQLAFLFAYPLWGVILIALDILIIWALIVHGGEAKSTEDW